MHFYLEHNFGHHLNVATPNDPVTAKYNEPLYSFWISAVFGELYGAMKIQRKRLQNKNMSFFSLQNDMLWYGIIQLIYLVTGLIIFGFKGFIAFRFVLNPILSPIASASSVVPVF